MFDSLPDPRSLIQQSPPVHLVTAAVALAWYTADSAVIIDVRERFERALEHVPGTLLRPLSTFDPYQSPPTHGRRLLLMCAVGVRCEPAALALVQAGHPGPVYRVEGGLSAWCRAGGPVMVGSSA
ncbi:rhodanese-like domain-containing protein [uncultured Rhodospira sp.]|uniref:rhodanese-like domain-containing protein n=1 Tax=uncultured Rhodospira sp. TaxID=1936189 RepID=UPI002637E86A|nr:rhodanese-like domain-containing protein [uncultured Rhodospira sp.]